MDLSNKNNHQNKVGWDELVGQLKTNTFGLDHNPNFVAQAIQQIITESKHINNGEAKLTNLQLIDVFRVSMCLGFSLWQYLAALERLEELSEWQNKESELWKKIKSGETTVGLGITHLGKARGILEAKVCSDGVYTVSGKIPWVSGYDFFDMFVVGYNYENKNIVCLLSSTQLFHSSATSSKRLELSCLAGTSSVELIITNLKINEQQILSITEIGQPTRSSKTEYIFPEIGMALRALEEVKDLVTIKLVGEKKDMFLSTEERIREIVMDFISKFKTISNVDYFKYQIERDRLMDESIKLLTLVEAGSSIKTSGLSSLFIRQKLLVDAVLQPMDLLKMKLQLMGRSEMYKKN